MVNRIMYAMNDDWPVSDDHGCKMNESVERIDRTKKDTEESHCAPANTQKLRKREMLVLSI